MKDHSVVQRLSCVALVAGSLAGAASADLPTHPERSWQTDFAGFQTRKYILRINSGAEGKIEPVGDSGKPVAMRIFPSTQFFIEETQPNGKVLVKKVDYDTLETEDKPFLREGKATFRGKVAGGASFEGYLAISGGDLIVGGKLLDPGDLKNPLRLGIRVYFPSLYKNAKEGDKAFEKKLKGDRYAIQWTDGKRVRLDGTDKVSPEEAEKVNGPGISQFAMTVADYQGRSFEIKASEHSALFVQTKGEQLPHEGLALHWYPDPAKDPKAEARLTFRIR